MDLEKIKLAGSIAAQSLAFGKELIKKGNKVLDVLDKIEGKVEELGAKPAFPAQISMNEIAAHFCPEENDETTFSDQVVSLDVGVHVDGVIGDNAVTVDLSGEHGDLVKASRDALDAAIEVLGIGVKVADVGKAISQAIESAGFKPVRNLSGHGLGMYNVHMPPTMPNYDTGEPTVLEKGMHIAIEPFASTGAGMVHERGEPSVFALEDRKSVRVGFVRNIQKEIEKFQGLPFTTRWISRKFSEAQVRHALNQFKLLGILREYPPLVDKNDGLVSQAEHSFYIDDEVMVTTKI